MLRSGKRALLIGNAVAMAGIGLGGSRPQTAATEPPFGVSAHSCHAPCRSTAIAGMTRLPDANVVRGRKRLIYRGHHDFSPDRFERAAVLGAVKAEPCGWPPRRPALTAPARGCLGRPRVGAEKWASGRTEKLGWSRATRHPHELFGSIVSSLSTAPPQDRCSVR